MIKAKKSLGQNFLKSEIALKKIIEAGEIKSDLPAQTGDIILEIGPGKGALTEKLLLALRSLGEAREKSGLVIAIEKDRELFDLLKSKFKEEILSGKLKLINDDILTYKVPAIRYKLIANIPYNITGAILKKFLTEENKPERMILLVQNEVAKRIVASDHKESILSISVKAYGEPKMIMKVGARYFSPAPKVDSAIISIKNISREKFRYLPNLPLTKGEVSKTEGVNEDKFWEIVKAGFAHKRKKLSSNLKSSKYFKDLEKNPLFKELGNKRAEDLTLFDWITLAKE
ncbi:ribosomal RNA small subunit methyltransferase A [Candidatus Nomurabacteria bacterium]|nr:ribosomal RNA small subunit methyltransferase A [Candidatus Nomurabacteria bacterium]